MMTLISWVNRIYRSQGSATVPCQPVPKNIPKIWVNRIYQYRGLATIPSNCHFVNDYGLHYYWLCQHQLEVLTDRLYKCCRFLFAGSLIYPGYNGIKKRLCLIRYGVIKTCSQCLLLGLSLLKNRLTKDGANSAMQLLALATWGYTSLEQPHARCKACQKYISNFSKISAQYNILCQEATSTNHSRTNCIILNVEFSSMIRS